MKQIIKLKDISKSFSLSGNRLVHALVNISFSINQGETLAVVGESGCGKSTLARVLLQLLQPDSGQIFLEGKDITGLSKHKLRPKRSRMQLVGQDPSASLNPRHTIGRSISEPLVQHSHLNSSERKQKTSDLLEIVGLHASDAGLYPHQFSGGQRQRICIARAIALNPALIVADEVTSALDVTVQSHILNLLLSLQREFNISYFFVSHDLAVVERISHRVAVLCLGQIVELGSRNSVFENPSHPYTKRLLSSVPVADPRHRPERNEIVTDIASPVWPSHKSPTPLNLIQIGPDHYIADGDPLKFH